MRSAVHSDVKKCMLPSMAGTRQTPEERRELALAAAREEFARAGMRGSADLIAERAGIHASYLLRLFKSKKALFLAVVERAFEDTGDKITFPAGTARNLNNVTVTLSSWACQQGTWNANDCVTQPGATFSQPITLEIWNADHTTQLATSTKTFDVPYRPSASPKCTGANAGKWYSPAKACKNGIANDVTFNFSNVTLPDTVQYEISYNTTNNGPTPLHVAGPYDSLNVALSYVHPSVGTSTDPNMYRDGIDGTIEGTIHAVEYANAMPMVQFKAGNGS